MRKTKQFTPHFTHNGRSTGYTGKKFQWKSRRPDVLVWIWLHGLMQCGEEGEEKFAVRRSFSSINYSDMMKDLWEDIPSIFTEYLEYTGVALTSDIVRERHHKMYYKNNPSGGVGPGSGGYSPEHPENHERLRPLIAVVKEEYFDGEF